MINKFENKEGMIIIKDYDTATEILKHSDFIVPDLVDFLDRLMEASGRDFSMLRLFVHSSPFFLEGERHTYLRKISSDFLGVKNYELWLNFFRTEIDYIVNRLDKLKEFDLVKEVGVAVFTNLLRPYLGVYPNDEQKFDEKAIVLQRLIEPMLSMNSLQQVNSDLCDLMENLNLNASNEEGLDSVLNQLLNGDFDLSLDEKKAYLIVLYAATAPLAQTMVNILINIYESDDVPTPETFLHRLDNYIWKSVAPIYIHRVALSDTTINEINIQKGNTVLIEIASSFKQNEKSCTMSTETKSLSFGRGKHFCSGAFISKSLISEFIPRFLQKYPHLEVISKQRDETNHIAHAYTSVIVKKSS